MMFKGCAADPGPVDHEGVMVPRGKGRHPRGFRIPLVFEEERQIGVNDLAQNHPYWLTHADSETAKRRTVKIKSLSPSRRGVLDANAAIASSRTIIPLPS
jgi:hypothetical protein